MPAINSFLTNALNRIQEIDWLADKGEGFKPFIWNEALARAA